METKIYDASTIDEAAELLKAGDLIAFPTETVYGLGAIASNDEAVKNVYKVKGRPSDNPLIVHVSDREIAKYVAFV
ncbi:MAG TPA: Sua5/YciO/YrdC/YwlC family protein, partial [Trichococcus flocculiformis]|nr:Sua5/YciO/YrdC/YwlC family protein [Trichococcus flocculiformis]